MNYEILQYNSLEFLQSVGSCFSLHIIVYYSLFFSLSLTSFFNPFRINRHTIELSFPSFLTYLFFFPLLPILFFFFFFFFPSLFALPVFFLPTSLHHYLPRLTYLISFRPSFLLYIYPIRDTSTPFILFSSSRAFFPFLRVASFNLEFATPVFVFRSLQVCFVKSRVISFIE